MSWTDAPAGLTGTGSSRLPSPARPVRAGGPGVVIAPIAAPFQGSGVPVAARLRSIAECGVAHESFLPRASALAGAALVPSTDTNNGTTLGLHPPREPQS